MFRHRFRLQGGVIVKIESCVRRGARASALLLLFSLPPWAAAMQAPPSAEPPFLGGFLTETRIVYPLRVGDWSAVGEHLYEQQELGVSVRYKDDRRKERWIDLYFYPVGMLPPGEFAEVAERAATELRQAAEYRGETKGLEIDPLTAFVIDLPDGKDTTLDARSVSLRMPNEGAMYSSAMAITAHRMYLIKGRYSVDEGSADRAGVKRELERFVGDIVRATQIVSSGACWMPLPIVQKAAPLTAGKDATLHVDTKGEGVQAVAYADRVEALDTQSTEAKRMQLLGMVTAGRWFDGCGPQEDLNLQVPEDKREIRLEYRPAGQKSPRPAPVPKASASTVS